MRLDRLAQLQTGADRNCRTHEWQLYCVFGSRRMQSLTRWRCIENEAGRLRKHRAATRSSRSKPDLSARLRQLLEPHDGSHLHEGLLQRWAPGVDLHIIRASSGLTEWTSL